jgi:phosphoribosylanthranilate isomerase
MFLKICGITRLTDALHAVQHGATALGFVFWPSSPRCIEPDVAARIIEAVPAEVKKVGVFVNADIEDVYELIDATGIDTVQLHGDETPDYARTLSPPVVRSVTLEGARAVVAGWPPDTLLLLDAADRVRRGGTGVTVDWDAAADVARQRRVILAGGLTPENVGDAIAAVRPFGVDVSSGVEDAPGVKDFDKVSRFLANARRAFDAAHSTR